MKSAGDCDFNPFGTGLVKINTKWDWSGWCGGNVWKSDFGDTAKSEFGIRPVSPDRIKSTPTDKIFEKGF